MEEFRKYMKLILNIAIPVLFFYMLCIWGPKLLKFFLPFVIGWVIAMIANPLVRFLEKRVKIVRKHSSMMIVVVVLAVIIGILYLLIAKLVHETIGFMADIPKYYEAASVEVQGVLIKLENLLSFLPQNVQDTINQVFDNIGEYLNVAVQKIAPPTVNAAGTVVKSIPAALVYTVVTIFSSYLFIVDRDKIMEFLRKYMPEGGSKYYLYLKKDVKHLVGGYFLAQFKIMFIIAMVLAVGFLILGVDYALLLAVVIALLDFLPILGTGTFLIPWAVIRMFSGDIFFGVGLVCIYLVTLVLRQVIQPKIVGDTMGLDPLLTLLFLYLGFKWKGIAGMILAVPLGMLVLNLYAFGAFDTLIGSVKALAYEINQFRKSPDEREGDRK